MKWSNGSRQDWQTQSDLQAVEQKRLTRRVSTDPQRGQRMSSTVFEGTVTVVPGPLHAPSVWSSAWRCDAHGDVLPYQPHWPPSQTAAEAMRNRE